ncbi:cytochrome c class i [Rufibacter immobilis]|uniref:Cytochrome c class i n=1 Tax=Rufibacter immobilis TaxID=1348778 RepID=A0A3M9MRU3_9BACT|nr:c-type cytochrome [Rufibacter immobilis]RNI28209.1 cytochrome c class i [Rufibacter immobilis]
MKRLLPYLASALFFAGAATQPAAAQDAVKGKSIFDANCAACHSVQEQVVGPALKDVHKRRDEKWIINFVKNSTKVIASGDKQAVEVFEKFGKVPMTSFEGSLSDGDIKDVVAFIKEESDKPAEAKAPEVTPADPNIDGAAPAASGFNWKAMPPVTQILVTLVGFLLLLVLVFLLVTFFQALPLLSKLYEKPGLQNSSMAKFIALMRGDTTSITGKAKDELMEDHSYDGIHEFDNDLPPWWKYTFYVTIVFGVVYLLNYHVMGGQLQTQEYEAEMQQAALLSAKSGGGDANEKTDFKPITDAAQLAEGEKAFMQNCAACHGQKGEGMVGPNLTDEFWLHGSDVNGIYKTIKYGVTSKGMVAWQGKLSNEQILQVSSYILSLKGSNPPNAKAPQGEKAK